MPLTAFPHPGPIAGNTEIDGQPVPYPSLNFHRLTEPFSHAGVPAVSVPCGFDGDGLPFGMQIAAPFHGDAAVLRAASAYETAAGWSNRLDSARLSRSGPSVELRTSAARAADSAAIRTTTTVTHWTL